MNFFTVRDCRSFVGGIFQPHAELSSGPLTVYLGAYWVYEGIMKITEGWLTAPRLKTFLQSAKHPFLLQVITGTSASDAVSNATPAAGEAGAAAGKLLWDVGILGFIRFTVIQTSDIAVAFRWDLWTG
jgi:NADH dehydrogenase